jgi:hypothetical protein
MPINNAKHIIAEIDGLRCTVVETGATLSRAAFLQDLLSFNNYEVKKMQEPAKTPEQEPLFTIGVTDVVFNPVFAIYERRLKTPEGSVVTPGYWKQECSDCDPQYWLKRKGARSAQEDQY